MHLHNGSTMPNSMPYTRPRLTTQHPPTHPPPCPLQDKATAKIPLTRAALEAEVDKVRGAVMIAYPMGLPEWDLVRLALEDDEDLAGTQVGVRGGGMCVQGEMHAAGRCWPERCCLRMQACAAAWCACALLLCTVHGLADEMPSSSRQVLRPRR
jgi:hypothetical protein